MMYCFPRAVGDAASMPGRVCAGAQVRGPVFSVASVTQTNALGAAQATRPALNKIADLIERFGEDTGSKRLKVGDVRTLGFISTWENGVMRRYGTLKGEESDPAVNVVNVENRPPWEQVIFMVKDMSLPIVAVVSKAAVAVMSQRGYSRIDVNYYPRSSVTELPLLDVAPMSSSSSSSGVESVAGAFPSNEEATSSCEANRNEDGEDADVTIPFAFPPIARGGDALTAAEQIVYQFEVKHLCICLFYVLGHQLVTHPCIYPVVTQEQSAHSRAIV